MVHLFHVVILAIVQGLAELLPVSSSAHVIVAAKLLGIDDPSQPEWMLLIVMLHTGTMFAVILYFWRAWQASIFASREVFKQQMIRIAAASAMTAAIGLPLIFGIEHAATKYGWLAEKAGSHATKAKAESKIAESKIAESKAEVDPKATIEQKVAEQKVDEQKVNVEMLSRNLGVVACGLAAAGVLILIAGLVAHASPGRRPIGIRESLWIGAVQGFCLPFRGFSRSGATISTGLLLGNLKSRVEEFSFALAVIITPPAIGREVWRLIKHQHDAGGAGVTLSMFGPSLLGMVFAFLAGLLALRWLSRWLEKGHWHYFGIYCLVAAVIVFRLHCLGY